MEFCMGKSVRLRLAVLLLSALAGTCLPATAQQSTSSPASVPKFFPPSGAKAVISPDGLLQAEFVTDKQGAALYVTNVKTGEKSLVVRDPNAITPAGWDVADGPFFSQDGKKLVFEAGPARGTVGAVYAVNVDGSGMKTLASFLVNVPDSSDPSGKKFYNVNYTAPAFSPDGRQVLVQVYVWNDARDAERRELYPDDHKTFIGILAADKENQTPKRLVEGRPLFWSVDGSSIFYRNCSVPINNDDPNCDFHSLDIASGQSRLINFPHNPTILGRVPGRDAVFTESPQHDTVTVLPLDGTTVIPELALQAASIHLKDSSGMYIQSIESAGPHQVAAVYQGPPSGPPDTKRKLLKFE